MAIRTTTAGTCQVVVSPAGPLVVALAGLMNLPAADEIEGAPDLEQPSTVTLRSGGAVVCTLVVNYSPDGAPVSVALLPPS
ncbi:MAG: hypothetical protein ACK55H_09765 [Cyanobacteriota bacterium]|jgi:hypothetical protein